VYTQSHFDYLAEVIEAVWHRRDTVPGYRITHQPKMLRHFTCHLEPIV
jgi:tryptophanase